jgi:hypothetical protein
VIRKSSSLLPRTNKDKIMNPELKQQILQLYPEFKNVYGPYIRGQDKRKIVILYDGEKRSARQYAKVLLETKIGRRLVDNETVDHKDEDFSNDDPGNLQILTRSQNISKGVVRVVRQTVKCINCEKEFLASYDQINTRIKTKAGPFCSRHCSGVYGTFVQNGGQRVERSIIEVVHFRNGLSTSAKAGESP